MKITKQKALVTVTFKNKYYGLITMRIPIGKYRYLTLYFSPDGKPETSTFVLGKGIGVWNWAVSRIRKMELGHNFDVLKNKETLNYINSLNEWK